MHIQTMLFLQFVGLAVLATVALYAIGQLYDYMVARPYLAKKQRTERRRGKVPGYRVVPRTPKWSVSDDDYRPLP
jgi:hypothetical protein